ncbi:MAG: peptide chain release factor N(5)-glutamine methyltransferase [Clostridia bacterium]|nr:peptide chain release factor N(5)-glutamine methyltransferase [Clostridia bacterium]
MSIHRPSECIAAVKKILTGHLQNYEMQARWLVCGMLELEEFQLLINDKEVDDETYNKIIENAKRLADGYPLQYLLGDTQFMNITVKVREGVLIPRHDTEPLAQEAISCIGERPLSVLDMCCGSGCIGLAIKHNCKNARVMLADVSDEAIALSEENAKALDLDVQIQKTSMFEKIFDRFDVIVCNPPYIPSNEIPKLDKQVQYEPRRALDGDIDGLRFYRIISEHYKQYLKKNGLLLLEIGSEQGNAVKEIFGGGEILPDVEGRDRIFKLETE